MVPYGNTVVAVTDACTVVCVVRVCGCEGDGNAGVGDEGVVVVSVGHVCGTRVLGIVSSAADVLGMSVVRGMRGVGGVCVWLGAAWEERGWVDYRIGFGLYQSCGNRGSIGCVWVAVV